MSNAAPPDRPVEPIGVRGASSPDPSAILNSIGEVVYTWDLTTDALSWNGDTAGQFGAHALSQLSTGKGFEGLLDPLSPATRGEIVQLSDEKDDGSGVSYRFTFAIQLPEKGLTYFEDTGRWFAGGTGKAAKAHGVVRKVDARATGFRNSSGADKFDELTGAYHRTAFLRLMSSALEMAKPKGQLSAFLLISLQDLESHNRRFGFGAADSVIRAVAATLKKLVRGKDRMVRASSTKIGLLLSPFVGEDLSEAAARFRAALCSHPLMTDLGPMAIDIRIGAVLAPRDGQDAITLFQRAEEALAEAREPGAPVFVQYVPDAARDALRKKNLTVADDVIRILKDNRVAIAIEPVMSATGRVVQFHEALVRIRAEDGVFLPAATIIPPAERFGLIKYVDERVLELAVKRLIVHSGERLSVNVSMRTVATGEWLNTLRRLTEQHPSIADRLIVEITETAAMADVESTTTFVRSIKALGARVAIDDFGSGHTSFRSLRALPIDILKIDGVFVQNLTRSADDRFFVRTLVDLARNLGVQTIAEWVQDEEAAALLAGWGVDFLQGAFCGEAKPLADPTA